METKGLISQLKFACPSLPIPAKLGTFEQDRRVPESLNSVRHVIENLTSAEPRQDGPSHFFNCGGSGCRITHPVDLGDDPGWIHLGL